MTNISKVIAARKRGLGIGVLLLVPVQAFGQCSNASTTHLAVKNVYRAAGNLVRGLAGTQTVGDYWWTWDAYVQATETLNGIQIHSGSDQRSYGEIAVLEWNDYPSLVGVGTYALPPSTHRASSTCGGSTSFTGIERSLYVQRPTISTNPGGPQVAGIWWFNGPTDSSGGDAANGFYNQVNFYADPRYPNPEQLPIWIVETTGPQKLSLSCSACNTTLATSTYHSATPNDIMVRVVVGGIGGLSSDPYYFTVNYPVRVNSRGEQTSGLGDGYETRFSYETKDITNQNMPQVAMNERFMNQGDAVSNNWRDFVDRGFPHFTIQPGNIWIDKVSMFSVAGEPPLDPGLVPQDPTVVQYADQEWRVGSATVGQGVHLLTTAIKRRLGYATHDPRTYVPAP